MALEVRDSRTETKTTSTQTVGPQEATETPGPQKRQFPTVEQRRRLSVTEDGLFGTHKDVPKVLKQVGVRVHGGNSEGVLSPHCRDGRITIVSGFQVDLWVLFTGDVEVPGVLLRTRHGHYKVRGDRFCVGLGYGPSTLRQSGCSRTSRVHLCPHTCYWSVHRRPWDASRSLRSRQSYPLCQIQRQGRV